MWPLLAIRSCDLQQSPRQGAWITLRPLPSQHSSITL